MSAIVATQELITPQIQKPARYAGNELGAVRKPWENGTVRWALTYPEVYEVGSSNLGHIILYSIINAQPRQLCDRSYLPAADLAQKLRETKTPLFAVESKRPLSAFDILGFSLSYELGATNILEMLDLANIPLTWQERQAACSGDTFAYPLIFAGGQTATSNPEPYADFFDFIALGDGEELLPEIGFIVEEGKNAGLSREALLLDLAQIPGVYVPQFYTLQPDGSVVPQREGVPKRILRRVATPMPAYSIGLVPYVETVHDRLTIEIRRGCTRGCRFCQPGMLTRPARDVEPAAVVEAIERGMKQTGYEEFSLLSLSCSDYLALPAVGIEVKNRLKDYNISLSLPSQRVDRFDENIANTIGGIRQGSLTFAPEAGTQRLRDIINKGLTNEELLRGIQTAVDSGWDKIKLYFMIGLPGETDEDVVGIVETVDWLQRECRRKGRRPLNFNITISNFTPKPHTPFQWHSVSTAEFQRKQELLRREFRHLRGVKVNYTDVRISAMEDFIGRGDRSLSPVIRRAWELGAGMDAWWESLDRAYHAWAEAIAAAGLTWKYRQVEAGEWNVFGTDADNAAADDNPFTRPLPWDILDTGIDKQWLQEDLTRALAESTIPDCSFDGCSHCGVCGVDFGHNVVVPAPPIPTFTGHFTPNKTKAQRLRVTFGKTGDLSLVSHLDLLRVFDRAIRRSQIPIAYNGGFHPSPRIAIANALTLGATGDGEIVEFELTQTMDLAEFQTKLTAVLPPELPLHQVESVDLSLPYANQLISQSRYTIVLSTTCHDENSNFNQANWQKWIDTLLATPEIWQEKKTKSGKIAKIDLRSWLYSLELLSCRDNTAQIRYTGNCTADGSQLRPEGVAYCFREVTGETIDLLSIHREALIF